MATIYVPSATVRPIGVTANPGAWTTTGSADAATALADTDAATYTQSPDNPATAATERLRLAPLLTGSAFTLTVDHQITSASSGTAQVTLLEGATVRKCGRCRPPLR